jgi:hypothetical protein
VVEGRSQHHAAALEERHLRCTYKQQGSHASCMCKPKKKKKIRALGTEGVIHMNYVRGQDDSAAQIEKMFSSNLQVYMAFA